MSFTFGAQKIDFSFGNASGDAKTPQKPNAAKPTSAGGFMLGASPAVGTTSGFTVGTSPAVATNTGFSLGSSPAVAASTGFTLGSSPAVAASTGFALGASPAVASSTGFTLGSSPAVAANTTFNLGNPPAASTTTAFTLGSLPASSTSANVGTVTPKFNLATTSAPTSNTASTAATPTLGFPSIGTPAKTGTGLTFATPTTSTTTSTGFSLANPPATTTSLPTTAVSTSSVVSTPGTLTFNQLEDCINKWTIELEEQGKIFGNQAKQLNAWDRLLISNGEKVLALNNGILRVNQQQQQLDQELDFVLAQQKELEDLITPLEKDLNDLPVTDVDRNQTYDMAETMDTQLKQMSEDLKEIIEQLNEGNKTQEMSNPITQIGKILNAHMNSLQWVDRNTTKISTHLDQISKMHDLNRRSHEKSLQRTYD